jgi:hypothetical protein
MERYYSSQGSFEFGYITPYIVGLRLLVQKVANTGDEFRVKSLGYCALSK